MQSERSCDGAGPQHAHGPAAWQRQFPDSDVTELDAPRIGNPWGYSFNGALLYEPAFEYDYHSSYFTRLLAGIEKAVVLEIGGGFGGLAYHLLKRKKSHK